MFFFSISLSYPLKSSKTWYTYCTSMVTKSRKPAYVSIIFVIQKCFFANFYFILQYVSASFQTAPPDIGLIPFPIPCRLSVTGWFGLDIGLIPFPLPCRLSVSGWFGSNMALIPFPLPCLLSVPDWFGSDIGLILFPRPWGLSVPGWFGSIER